MNEIEATLSDLYLQTFGTAPESCTLLPGAGSDRRYYRLSASGHPSAIGTFGNDLLENRAFVNLAHCFYKHGCSVPQVYRSTEDYSCYLQEDLGDVSLFSIIKSEGESERVKTLVKKSIDRLIKMQCIPFDEWSFLVFNAPYYYRMVMWDLNYFKYCFLKPSGITFNEEALEYDFQRLNDKLSDISEDALGFMMRDCQSRNIMIRDEEPYFIDFQGGRLGPMLYDAISLLWQAKAGFSEHFRREMLYYYKEVLCHSDSNMEREISYASPDVLLLRLLQVLGAYGFRGLVEKKAHFLESISGALANLQWVLDKGCLEKYPELERVCRLLIEDPRFRPTSDNNTLTVKVTSFSYKKGYPADYTGNGGGFAFDCRAMHNPGRYEEYKHLTGADRPVIDFLESKGEVQQFLQAAWALTDPAVERYRQRGFTSLQINFGCTGGRHRSLYCAEATAKHIKELFPDVRVVLEHREQGIKRELI